MKGVKSALRRTETAWKNKIRTIKKDCELPHGGGHSLFLRPEQKGERE